MCARAQNKHRQENTVKQLARGAGLATETEVFDTKSQKDDSLRLSRPRWPLKKQKEMPRVVIHGAPRGGLKLSRTSVDAHERLQGRETTARSRRFARWPTGLIPWSHG